MDKSQILQKSIKKPSQDGNPQKGQNNKKPKQKLHKKAIAFNKIAAKSCFASKSQSSKDLLKDVKIVKRRNTEDSIQTELESKDHFEKNILRNPNNDELWIKYISYTQETEGLLSARKIADRALRVVNFRDEESKLNIWKAYLNIEFYFGNDASCSELFKKALGGNDSFRIIKHMTFLYKSKENWVLCEEFLKLLLKKGRKGPKSWTEYLKFLYEWKHHIIEKEATEDELSNINDKINEIYKRALQSLKKSEHSYFQVQQGILEFKYGEPEKGRTIFETIMNNYPKRTDILSVYSDMEMKYGKDEKTIRELFERFTSLILPHKKMKLIFVKFLSFETGLGNAKRIQAVKDKATEYINRLIDNGDEDGDDENEDQENFDQDADEIEL